LGFLLGLAVRAGLERPGPLVWLRAPGGDHGAPYGPGLTGFGLWVERLLIVRPRTHAEALWAAEEAVKTAGPAAVVAELSGPVDLCAGRRLQLAAEKAGALGLIWRPAGALPVAAARTRWRIGAAPSAIPAWAAGAGIPESAIPPGPAQFSAELVHAKGAPPAAFDLEWGHGARGFHLAALVADRAVLQGQSRRAA
jgi:protein ImuA